jgi:hypothetical protein
MPIKLQFASLIVTALMSSVGGAQATIVGPGSLSFALQSSPTVSLASDTIALGGPINYFSGAGAYAGFSGTGTTSSTTFTFSSVIAGKVSYTTDPIDSFVTFQNAGDTFSFNLDTSIKTTSWSYVAGANGTGQIALYFLGDLTDSEHLYANTPAAFTLTLNETGGSAWSASATLATPPPGTAPEPASIVLLGGGLAALGFIRRRRRT